MVNRALRNYLAASAAVLLLAASLIYIAVYIPMRAELWESTLEKFALEAEAKHKAFESYVDDGLEEARDLSANKAIRVAIASHLEGSIGYDRLKELVGPIYDDAAPLMAGAIGSILFMGDRQLSSWGEPGSVSTALPAIPAASLQILTTSEGETFTVFAPILDDSGTLFGWNAASFSYTGILKPLDDDPGTVRIVDAADAQQLVLKTHIQHSVGDVNILHEGSETHILFSVRQSGTYFHIHTADSVLFSSIRRMTMTVFAWTLLYTVLVVLSLVFLITKNYRTALVKISQSEERFRRLAYLDPLTGAYSRHYLEVWRSILPRRFEVPWSLVMVDADQFKTINDRYDHATGDRVLRTIAQTAQAALREHDIVVRYGGDEFLICMYHCRRNDAESAMRRIAESIASNPDFPFRIEVSFGVAEFSSPDRFDADLEAADRRMYDMKESKQAESADA